MTIKTSDAYWIVDVPYKPVETRKKRIAAFKDVCKKLSLLPRYKYQNAETANKACHEIAKHTPLKLEVVEGFYLMI